MKLTLLQIAERKSKNLNLDIEYCKKIVENLPEIFNKMKDNQITLCKKCDDLFAIDGRMDYHGQQTCQNCGHRDFCNTITPDYELIL